jgi:hypothetical protein
MPQYTDQPDDIAISLSDAFPTNDAVLEQRLGRLHAKLRLGIEMDHEAQIFGQGINFFHIENRSFRHSDDTEVDGIVLARSQECGADSGQTQSHYHEDTTEPLR